MIPVVFSSNNHFVPYLSTTIQSVLENANQLTDYSLFVLHQDITNENTNLLRTQIASYKNFKLEFIDVTEYIKDYHFFTENRTIITKETYFRLLIPYILKDYEKVIYLDCDMICCTDIAELYNIDLGNTMLGSTRDLFGACSYYSLKHKKPNAVDDRFILENQDDYFNAGLLVFNTAYFRQAISLQDLLKFAVSKRWTWHDMDILNSLCEKKITFFPLAWNFYDIGSRFDILPECWKKLYLEAEKEKKIIHFADCSKPWLNCHTMMYFELFWKYATRTPFINEITGRMKKEGYIQPEGISRYILYNIKHRQGIGLDLLLKGLFVWLFLRKK